MHSATLSDFTEAADFQLMLDATASQSSLEEAQSPSVSLSTPGEKKRLQIMVPVRGPTCFWARQPLELAA